MCYDQGPDSNALKTVEKHAKIYKQVFFKQTIFEPAKILLCEK